MLASPVESWHLGADSFAYPIQVKCGSVSDGARLEIPFTVSAAKLCGDPKTTPVSFGISSLGSGELNNKHHDYWKGTTNQGSHLSRPSTSCSVGSDNHATIASNHEPTTGCGNARNQVASRCDSLHSSAGSNSTFQPLEIELYKEHKVREVLFWLCVLISCGILYILNRWFPWVVARVRFQRCSSKNVLRESTVGVLWVASPQAGAIRRQLVKLSRLEVDPEQLGVAVPRLSTPVRLRGFGGSHVAVDPCACRRGASECLVRAPYFDFNCRRYVLPISCEACTLSPKEQQFFPVKFDWESLTVAEIRNLHCQGLRKSSTLNSRRQLFGDCEILVPVRSPLELILDECLHPFYLFQVLSVALWFADHYFYYATAVVFLSAISLFLTIRETIQNNMNLHKMARFSCPVEILREKASPWNDKLPQSSSGFSTHSTITLDDFDFLRCNSTKLLPGDLFVLHRNMRLPCDAILLCGTALVDEAMLTGETKPIYKTALPPQDSTIFNFEQHKLHVLTGGSETRDVKACPATGAALCLVARMGFTTTQGEMMRSLLYPEGSTRLNFEHEAWKFVGFLGCLSCFTFSWTLYQGLVNGLQPRTVALRALDTITIAVPPALPIIVSVGVICAAQALRKLHHTRCLLPSRINVAGRANVVVFDKTGTLTEDDEDLVGVAPTEKFRFKGSKGNREDTPTNGETSELGVPASIASACSAELVAALAACHNLSFADDELIGDPLDYQLFRFTGWELHGAQLKSESLHEPVEASNWQSMIVVESQDRKLQSAAPSPSTMASPYTPSLSEGLPSGIVGEKGRFSEAVRELEATPLGELNPCSFVSVVPTCNEDLISGSSCCEYCREWIQEGEELSDTRGAQSDSYWPDSFPPTRVPSFDNSRNTTAEIYDMSETTAKQGVPDPGRTRSGAPPRGATTIAIGLYDTQSPLSDAMLSSPPPARRARSFALEERDGLLRCDLEGSGTQSTGDSTSCSSSSSSGHFHNINSNGNNTTSVADQEQVIIKVFEFDAVLQRMSVIAKNFASGYLRAYTKGSPERIIQQCRPESLPQRIQDTIAFYASQGLRLLAIAGKKLDSTPGGCADPLRLLGDIKRTEIECDLEFMALLLFSNLLRPDSGTVVRELQRAGCAVYIATGDGAATGAAVAVESNIIPSVATCLISGTLVGDVVQWESRALQRPKNLGSGSQSPNFNPGFAESFKTDSEPSTHNLDSQNRLLRTQHAATQQQPNMTRAFPHQPRCFPTPSIWGGDSAKAQQHPDRLEEEEAGVKTVISTSLFKVVKDSGVQLDKLALSITGEAFRRIVQLDRSSPHLLVAMQPSDTFSWRCQHDAISGSSLTDGGSTASFAVCRENRVDYDVVEAAPEAPLESNPGFVDVPSSKSLSLRSLWSRKATAAMRGASSSSQFHQNMTVLEFILRHFHVFCRMGPDDKALLIRQLQGLRCKPIVSMCGDGANDCAALKAADVGVSLSSAEASVAAPFNCATSPKSVAALLGVLREGRGALACSVQSFQFAALYALIQLASVALLSKFGTTLSDSQFLYMDLLVVPPITYLLSWSASNRLCRALPPESLLAPSIVFSILGQIGLQTLFQASSLFLLLPLAGADFYRVFHIDTENSEHVGGFENTIIFLVTNVQTVCVAVVLALGTRPWKALSRNVAYLLVIQIFAAICVALILNEAVYMIWLRDLLNLESLPLGFRTLLLLAVIINVIFSAAFELLVIRKILRGREVRQDERQSKLRGTVVGLVGEFSVPPELLDGLPAGLQRAGGTVFRGPVLLS